MNVRTFARVLGIVFVVIAILPYIPGTLTSGGGGAHDSHDLAVTGPGTGYLLGLFHVNVIHNLAHLTFGVLGLMASRRYDTSRNYARFVAIAYGALALIGLIPNENINTLFGLMPIHGHDVWLHLLLAAAGAYFGWGVPVRDDLRTGSADSATRV